MRNAASSRRPCILISCENILKTCDTGTVVQENNWQIHQHTDLREYGLDCAVFYVHANRLYGRRFLQVKRPNQQYQSTEGRSTKAKQWFYTVQCLCCDSSRFGHLFLLTYWHIFFPVTTETAGSWSQQATELVQEIGRRTTVITADSRETTFLFQRLSMALQKRNVVSFLGTFHARFSQSLQSCTPFVNF